MSTINMAYFESLLGLLLCLFVFIGMSQAQNYKATVIVYKVIHNPGDLPPMILTRNKERYVSLVNDLKDETDIVVFPEYGLTTIKVNSELRAHLDSYSVSVPDPGTQSFTDPILPGISSAAKSNALYVVVNVLERSNTSEGSSTKYYSTDVVFGPDGSLVAKCRKKYLLSNSAHYDKGDPNQKCTFTATFTRINRNVNFALLFDTDIVEGIQDKTISDGILTSALPNKLPLSFGLSLQLGFSLGNKMNLLVSAYASASDSYGGTGIYLKNGTSRVTLGTDALLQQEIPINQNANQKIDVALISPLKPDVLENLHYEDITTLPTTNTASFQTFADGSSYCKLNIDSNKNDIQPYKWVAYTGLKEILGQRKEVIICGLIKPEQNKNQTEIVNSITVNTATTTQNIIQVLPLSLAKKSDGTIVPTDFHYEEQDNSNGVKSIKLKLAKSEDLIIFGVLFILKSAVSHGASIHISYMSLVGTLSLIVFVKSRFM